MCVCVSWGCGMCGAVCVVCELGVWSVCGGMSVCVCELGVWSVWGSVCGV